MVVKDEIGKSIPVSNDDYVQEASEDWDLLETQICSLIAFPKCKQVLELDWWTVVDVPAELVLL